MRSDLRGRVPLRLLCTEECHDAIHQSVAADHPEFHWARANGWAFLATVDLLDVLPAEHPGRSEILDLLRAHSRGLARCQSGSGFWHHLLDRNDSYLETSATAIYTYWIAHAINKDWLDPLAYGPMAALGWNAVSTKLKQQGQVEGTCVGTGMGFDPAFYYHRPTNVFAAHGYGPTILAGAEMLNKLDRLMTPPDSGMISRSRHVDFSVFGVVPLEAYLQTKADKYLDLGKGFADRQWEEPTPDGITREARYWIDDMFMITAVQVQAYRATGDPVYLDRAALTMSAYLDKLQRPNGLFFHALDTPFYWSRGNGWVAAGMAELLRSLPQKHPGRERIMAGYRKMMEALLKYQGDEGLWRQLIDRPGAWSETSGTGMFTFAMVTGVKNGWLDAKSYGKAARAAWVGLVRRLDQDANVADVCAGTNKLNDLTYYLNRPRILGDLHGQAPILWSASALMR